MSAETDNTSYTGLCLWDSCFDCPHMYDCEYSSFLEKDSQLPPTKVGGL